MKASVTKILVFRKAFSASRIVCERPKVDRAVLRFLKGEALHPADFTIREDGG